MHCEGCANKVLKSLRGFDGVEEVETDRKNHKVIVKGEKADPLKVLERVKKKYGKNVELLSPIPKAKEPQENKKEEKEKPRVMIVVLKAYMHCENCAVEIKKTILKMKGVRTVEPDTKNSTVTVKGVFDPPKLIDHLHNRAGKHAVILKQDEEKKQKKQKVNEMRETDKKIVPPGLADDGTRRATSTSLSLGLGLEPARRRRTTQSLMGPFVNLLKPRYPDTRAKKADVFVGTSFVCLALVSRTTGTSRNGPDQSGLPRIRTQVQDLRMLRLPSWYHLRCSADGTRGATSTSLRHGRGFESWGRHPKGQINKWPHKTLRCPASPRRLKPRYPDTRAKKADVFVGTSFVCLALVSRTTGTSWNGPDQSGLPRI
ncbi:Heavy metal-associated isoprenylated plant protein 8 [Vitis vinifera]|uniref:Heavy metal-associated isoprenylated plant protein 8 n=1 Tax=Vitis vinifera TaxID=29760 RepID=A0A438HHY5_VITVI|nr:Heavy metal-associated isoprenylated plant protein 8 [Vitis vinifera]